MKKKILSGILLCLMVITLLPIEELISLGASFKPDLVHEYSWFKKGSAEAQSKLQEAKNTLNILGVKPIDENRVRNLNYKIYAMYGIVAYGSPSFDDYKTGAETITDRTEYRYLGYDYSGKIHITNDYFPNDATSQADLLNKNWVANGGNVDTWEKTKGDNNFKNHIYTTYGLLNDGSTISYSLKDILAKRPESSKYQYKEDYINLQTIPKFSVNGSVRLSHRTSSKTWYDTFTIPSFGGDIELNVLTETPRSSYTIMPTENYIDIPVTVSTSVTLKESFLESYIASKWVKFDGIQKEGDSYTYTKRFYKRDLSEGTNKITVTGYGGVQSGFPNDQPIIKSDEAKVDIIVAEDNLVAQLNVPKTGEINVIYPVKDASYIPQGARVVSSTLEKKINSGSYENVDTWKGNCIEDSHPVKATITYKLTVTSSNGQTDTDTKTIQILDNRSVNATAKLDLNEYTYEGHPTYAYDVSEFEIEGESYSSARAYDEGLASNDFDVVESTPHNIKRLSDTIAKIIFNKKGFYNVRLDVETQDGKKLYDIEPIEVRKTPTIEDLLGGVQKQNRKQILNLSVAITPEYPITDFWVEIKDKTTGEKVHLTSSKVNSTNIKTRNITKDETEYFTNYTLEFLTKNTTQKEYEYTAYARDSKGDTDTVTKSFTVYPDLPPTAQIDMLDAFIRNEGSNTAEIIAEDGTVSMDGDQVERTWNIQIDENNNGTFESTENYKPITDYGFKDLSFGSKQKVQFNKTGVGKVQVRLDVKEVWTEPTLEEYVSDADRKTGATTKDTDVQNISPMVSVEPIETCKEDVLILTTEKDIEEAKNQKTALEKYFKENGIDSIVNIASFGNEDTQSLRALFERTQFRKDAFSSYHIDFLSQVELDNKYLYIVKPSNTLEVIDIETNNTAWRYTVDSTFKIKQSHTGEYIYLICPFPRYNNPEKTLILNKKTGALITTLDFKIEGTPYYTENNLYFFTNGAIKKLDNTTKTVNTIHNIGSEVISKIDNKIHFVFSKGAVTYRGIFDPLDESIKKEYIIDTYEDNDDIPYQAKAIDSQGNILLSKEYSKIENGYYEYYRYLVKVISNDNKLLKSFNTSFDINQCGINEHNWVLDDSGKAQYVYFVRGYKDGNYYDHKLNLYEINGDKAYSITKWRDSRRMGSQRRTYLRYLEDENEMLVILGGDLYRNSWGETKGRSYKIDLESGIDYSDSDNTIEFMKDSNRYIALWNTLIDWCNTYIKKDKITLEDEILRSFYEYGYFREGSQKNVIIIDDVNTNNEEMTRLIDSLKKKDIKVITIEKNGISNYLDKIQGKVEGKTIQYHTSMNDNLLNSANIINTNKEAPQSTVVKISGQGNSQAKLSNAIELEEGENYIYEYDIKYTKKGSSNKADIFNIKHEINNKMPSSSKVVVPTGKTITEEFLDYKTNPFFTYSGDWERKNYFSFIDRLYATHKGYYSGKTKSKTENVSFTLEEDAVLSFDYAYVEAQYTRTPERYLTEAKLEIYIDDIKQPYTSRETGVDEQSTSSVLYFSKELPKGEHTLKLVYYYEKGYASQYTEIDNLKIRYINKKNDGSYDKGALTNDTKDIIENEWQHIQGSYRTPYKTPQYTKSNQGSLIYEDFSDNNFNFTFVSSDYHAQHGVYKPITDTTSGKISEAKLIFTVPYGKVGYLYLESRPVATHCSYYNYLNRVVGDTSLRRSIKYSSLNNRRTYINPWLKSAKKYEAGTHEIQIRSFPPYYQHIHLKYSGHVEIDNVCLRLEPTNIDRNTEFIDDNMTVYKESKEYLGNSTLMFDYNSSENAEFLIKNFKIYKVVDGKKILWKDYGTITQDTLDRDFTTTTANAQITIANDTQQTEEEPPMIPIYKKGELIVYNIYYNDYENDPSKKEYWQYTHTPFNDGIHPEQGKILNTPIDRFFIDGKYVVKHWQEDSTGVTSYDKESNSEEITFYVMGNSTAVPEVTYIKTLPSAVKEGQTYKIQIGVNDEDLDDLDTTIELYKNNHLIYTYKKDNVKAINGSYPPIVSGTTPKAQVGKYTIVATARDDTGVGMRNYQFTVVSEGKIEGEVHHTTEWDNNRKKYNIAKTGNENSPRAYNVFWSGEKFMLKAETEGNPHTVHVEILNEGYETYLSSDDKRIWEGAIFEDSMLVSDNYTIVKWGQNEPEPLNFRFTAYFDNGTTRTHDVQIIVDHQDPYWKLHRVW